MATAACLLLGLWTYDLLGYQRATAFETENPSAPAAALSQWQAYQDWHPTRHVLRPGLAQAEEAQEAHSSKRGEGQQAAAREAQASSSAPAAVADPDRTVDPQVHGTLLTYLHKATIEPENHGPRVFNLGSYIGRSDRTTFYLGYRQIDPLQSRAVITSLTYAFSAKYAVTFGSNFDFGNNIQSNSLMITRIGTDVTVNFGLSYSSVVKTFGMQFEVVPNLLPGHAPGSGAFGASGGAAGYR